LPLAITQLLFEALVLLFERVDALLFLKTVGTEGHAHQFSSSVGGENCGWGAVGRHWGTWRQSG
jgi:hypothetical protein